MLSRALIGSGTRGRCNRRLPRILCSSINARAKPNKSLDRSHRQRASHQTDPVLSWRVLAAVARSTAPFGGYAFMDSVAEIQSMWDAWRARPFPSEYAGKDVAGICVTSIDSFAAGCIDTFISRKGNLDEERISVLQTCKDDLET